ncbi:MAG: DsrE family protein [Candidatus Jordarchaeaceae archaeon]
MGEKTVLIFVKSKPFSNLNYYEALRVASGLLVQHRVILIWMGDGVYAALKDADKRLTSKFYEVFPDMDITLYVEEESLKERGLGKEDIIPEAKIISRNEVPGLVLEAQASIVF